MFILLCFPLFLFSLFLAFPFFTFCFFVSLSLFLIFFLPCFLFLIYVSGSCFFCFCCVCFLVSRCYLVVVFFFFCLLSCFVLSHNLRFDFALHRVFLLLFFVFVAFIFCLFLFFATYQKNISGYFGHWKKGRNNKKNTEKMDILTGAVSTGVLTNSVFFFLC